ncbi:tetratricopeptide repeat protein [Shewanella colwelliana]|uniref:tetratricopeptide repeat protein n=1 Tax=Shewanella colwelliana TaxID=23 RepID=UPI0022AED521|nr:tetratricopeptide repeat protein [Shewanella colwelliana]MCZ4339312.1 tetratricopeptide repeat protein [Shewanella colwelliana]
MNVSKIITVLLILIIGSLVLPLAAKPSVKSLPMHLSACDSTECSKKFKEYKTLSRYGHSDAMYTLAEMYRVGYGANIDMRLATKWYRRAARLGNPFAQYKAAIIYLQDTEEQDVEKAMRYLRSANRADLSEAAHLLGMLYLEGDLVEKDAEKSKEYLTKAYEAEYPPTMMLLAEASDVALASQVLAANTVKHKKQSIAAPTDEMEVIEVQGLSLEEVFNYHISIMRNGVPDGASGTGTSLRGRTCGEMIACNTETDKERIRDFLMSTW